MPVAEDVATFAAVVATDKVAEVALAGRVVADGGFSVGLVQMVLAWDEDLTGIQDRFQLTFQCLRVGCSVTSGKRSRFHSPSMLLLPLSLARRPNCWPTSPPRLMKPVLERRSVVSDPESELESPDLDLVKGCDGNSLFARRAAGM